MTVKRRILLAGGWGIAKRLIKPVPIVGSFFALGLVVFEIRKKGLLPGVIHVGLDITPVVGTAKNVVEIFTGDLIPDRTRNNSHRTRSIQQAEPQQAEPQAEALQSGGQAVSTIAR